MLENGLLCVGGRPCGYIPTDRIVVGSLYNIALQTSAPAVEVFATFCS
jgi:hypothetical protein